MAIIVGVHEPSMQLTEWAVRIGVLLIGLLGFGTSQCGSTRSNPPTAWYDDSVELKLERDAAAEAVPAEPSMESESSVTNAGDAAAGPAPTPLELEGSRDAGTGSAANPVLGDAGPQPTGDVDIEKSGKRAPRAIRLFTDGRCRSQILCPQPMDQHGPRYCGEPKLVPCSEKLRAAWRERKRTQP